MTLFFCSFQGTDWTFHPAFCLF
ncbi:hypothetical protein CY0110_19182 [Crocosphaera chwakensis CCY0110]|uniref:Uncharacterized protein n=1 Tax=Crocosphaera chwakensis CCY0110 TaxID=391612 RepID=A3IJG8_9CHRO|nr:hypothetical protein CY0110_19182 [Crocosphaera chwakensis CCY0110]